jgi:uncharacterized protein (TIGR02611 family)
MSLRESWDRFKGAQPGRRFEAEYHRARERRTSVWKRRAVVVLGIALIAIGVVALPAPGPGWLVIGAGGALLARESLTVAHFLDSAEVRGRRLGSAVRRRWKTASPLARAIVGFGIVVTLIAFAAAGYWWLTK